MYKFILIPAAALSLLLAGCSDEQATETSPPAAQEPAEPSTAQQALDRLSEAAGLAGEAAREEAQRLREQAEQALEDAGPALDQAGKLATQLRGQLEVFAGQALEDLNAGAADLERRLREATGAPLPVPGDSEAVLPPADQLNADTRAAAAPRPAGVVPDYVGVWAADAAACSRIDQEAIENFAVITPTTIRRAESVCNIDGPALSDGRATAQASCFAEGEEEQREVLLELAEPDRLSIGTVAAPGTADLIRCHLPQ